MSNDGSHAEDNLYEHEKKRCAREYGWLGQTVGAGGPGLEASQPTIARFVYLFNNYIQGHQYVTDHPTMVIANTASNAPTLITLRAFPCPNR
jgi:hypothetical protein